MKIKNIFNSYGFEKKIKREDNKCGGLKRKNV